MNWWEKAIATIYFAFERVMNATGKKKPPPVEPPNPLDDPSHPSNQP